MLRVLHSVYKIAAYHLRHVRIRIVRAEHKTARFFLAQYFLVALRTADMFTVVLPNKIWKQEEQQNVYYHVVRWKNKQNTTNCLPNFVNEFENSKIPLKPLFCVLAVRGRVTKVTSRVDSDEYSTRLRCWPQ